MKKLLIIIFLFVLIDGLNAEEKKDWHNEGLKGRVKEKIEFYYKLSTTSTNLDKKIITRYNRNGYKIEKSNYSYYGPKKPRLSSHELFDYYDKINKLKKSTLIIQDNIPDNKNIFRYKYYKKEKATKTTILNSKNNIECEYVTEFDDKANKIRYTEYNSGKALMWDHIYKYNKKNQIIEYNIFNSYGKLYEKEMYKYDHKGDKIESKIYSPENTIKYKCIYKYDIDNHLIERSMHTPRIPGIDSKPELTHRDKYNKNEDIVESTSYDSKGSIISKTGYSYNYDNKGNKIEEKEYIPKSKSNKEMALVKLTKYKYIYWE